MLLLTDILRSDCVKVPLQAQTKQEAIDELAQMLAQSVGIEDADALKQAIWQREQTRTTGIGHGIAIPHGKVAACDELVMAVGLASHPIDFGAIDGKPVELIFLLASPLDQTGPHIQALASISRMLTVPELRGNMKQCASADDLYNLIAQHESRQPTG